MDPALFGLVSAKETGFHVLRRAVQILATHAAVKVPLSCMFRYEVLCGRGLDGRPDEASIACRVPAADLAAFWDASRFRLLFPCL